MTDVIKTLSFATPLTSDATLEKINATFEYCKDFTNDGKDDIKVTLSVDAASNSGHEDIIGVAFDVNESLALPWSSLKVLSIDNGPLTSTATSSSVSLNGVTNRSFPGLAIQGGSVQDSYDVGVKFNNGGEGDGITQTGSFILSMAGTDLDASTLFDNSDFFIRLQSTNGGGQSSKMGGHVNDGDLPPCPDGVIEGHKYLDKNGAAEGGKDIGLEGWKVNLSEIGDPDGDGTPNELVAFAVTGADGSYKFEELYYGSYKVEEVVKSGWYATSPASVNASVSAGDKAETVDFNNTEHGKIEGHKYEDTNGAVAGGLVAKGGWDITLLRDTDTNGSYETVVGTTQTDAADGSYSFGSLELGNYQLAEGSQAGWYNISPTTQNVVLDESGETCNTDTDFVNAKYAKVTATKYNDDEGDHSTVGDAVLPGWSFTLKYTNPGDAQVTTTVTDGGTGDADGQLDGSVSFANLLKVGAQYSIDEVQQANWTQTVGVGGYQGDIAASGETDGWTFANHHNPPPPPDCFPEHPQDISNVVLYFNESDVGTNLDTKPAGGGDGYVLIKIDNVPGAADDDLDTWIADALNELQTTVDPDLTLDNLLGAAIKGGLSNTNFYAFNGNTNGTAPDPYPSGAPFAVGNDNVPGTLIDYSVDYGQLFA